jgi:hypothetical protein
MQHRSFNRLKMAVVQITKVDAKVAPFSVGMTFCTLTSSNDEQL